MIWASLDKMTKPILTLSESEKNARFYYHGTSKFYFDRQVKDYGRYQHNPYKGTLSGVCIAPDYFDLAANYACDRTDCFAHTPIVLKINGDKVRKRVHLCPTENVPIINFIRLSELEIIGVDRDRYLEYCKKQRR